jgi:predicted membrane channel-forming protein YqfA (hemolysin III family)
MNFGGIGRFLQPIGFSALIGWFLVSDPRFNMPLFYLGIALTIVGIIFEIVAVEKQLRPKGNFNTPVFYISAAVKILLLAAIAYRVYDLPKSFYVLTAIILLSFGWNLYLQSVKNGKRKQNAEDILDQ